jgi:hypothetical protein
MEVPGGNSKKWYESWEWANNLVGTKNMAMQLTWRIISHLINWRKKKGLEAVFPNNVNDFVDLATESMFPQKWQ